MDLYHGAVGVSQQHDYSPGIPPSGLFWTQPVSRDSVDVDFEDGRARVRVSDLAEQDAHTLLNALEGGPTTPATVSFDMRWRISSPPKQETDATHKFTGRFFFSSAPGDFTIQWSAKEEGFTFESDPADTSKNVMSVFGRERNGIFFAQEDDEEGDD